jgi:hypothetical protein
MLNTSEIDSRLISTADAVYAEVLYEFDMVVKPSEFFFLKMKKETLMQQFLNFNLYKMRL